MFSGFWALHLVAQCGATPASVAAAPSCSATPFQRQLDVRHSWQFKGDRCDRAFRGGCSAILLLHPKKPRILRKSAATRVARQGVPAHVCNYGSSGCPLLIRNSWSPDSERSAMQESALVGGYWHLHLQLRVAMHASHRAVHRTGGSLCSARFSTVLFLVL